MREVIVISSSMVRPQNINRSGHREKIHLTPHDLDLLYLYYPQRGLLFHKPDPENRFIPRLMASLSTALEIYFPFAGRLVKVNNQEDDTVSFYIECDGSGAKFVHAKAESVTMNDVFQSHGSVPDFMPQFFPANNVQSRDALVSEPLLALQVTEIKDGVFISFGYNHMVADGSSLWNFFHTWSKICLNGSDSNIQPLVLKDWVCKGIDYPVHIPVLEMETLPRCEPSTKERVFHFSKKKVSDLKAKANYEISTMDLKISSLQAVVAYLWLSIIRHSGLAKPRRRNAMQSSGGYETEAKPSSQERVFWEFGSRLANNSLIVASSPRFDVYNHDFGWGKPIAARAGPADGTGGMLVMFRGVEEGSIDVHATLNSSLWSDVLVNLLINDMIGQ
ncbi:Transferase [Arabidopsis thaliana x Arabidopsis arenosa]|uniref:Transferase n=1 Tax=Arabidopsis thaliana x Arabidopsis arenosa TaxID=1240361 RepID=A0A8T1YCS3_9BRAS|nr:Transferase [Arabidopsis thaliana x Arabidopsis arenosa]